MTRPTGAPCWMDLLTSDTGRAREFYGELFGWTAGEASQEFGGYFMFLRDGVPVAGCMPKIGGAPLMEGPDRWGVYLSSQDAKITVDKALASGGILTMGPMDIAGLGTEAVLLDATGARIGVWQASGFPGVTVFGQLGTPVYFELLTRGYRGASVFYGDVFGWDARVVSDTPELRLTVLTDSGETIAGIMDASAFLPADEPDHWKIYIKVADTDAALATVAELGGTVVSAAMDTPYGRLAEFADPTGARLKLMSRAD
jgi:predicted enzyme related to lactoylglutathione lyase